MLSSALQMALSPLHILPALVASKGVSTNQNWQLGHHLRQWMMLSSASSHLKLKTTPQDGPHTATPCSLGPLTFLWAA